MPRKKRENETLQVEEGRDLEDETKEAIHEAAEEISPPIPGERPRLDLNTATVAELRDLPGIGPELAAEIVAYRMKEGPFQEPSDVTRVPGISAATYEQFGDLVTVGSGEPEMENEFRVEEGQLWPVRAEDRPVEEEPPPVTEEWALEETAVPPAGLEEVEEEERVVVEEAPPPPPTPPRRPVAAAAPPPRRGVGWGSLLLIGLLSAALGALLALLVLYGVNGTINLRREANRQLRGETFRLEGDLETVRADTRALEGRLAEFEGLASEFDQVRDQVRELGGSVDSLSNEVETASQELADMQTTLAGLSDDMVNVEEVVTALESNLASLDERVSGMQESVVRFDTFLTGLRDLLDQAEGLPERPRGATPEGTPMGTLTPGPTPTPEADVTVIPLATPTP